jgi:hypothetical protein
VPVATTSRVTLRIVSRPATVIVPSSPSTAGSDSKPIAGWLSASKKSAPRTCARNSAGEVIEMLRTCAAPDSVSVPSPSAATVARTSAKDPRNVETPMWRTAKPTDEWSGSAE